MSFSSVCMVCVVVMQHESRALVADNLTSVEFSVDANSKSAANLALSRPRPVSVPVHTMAADPELRKLVSRKTLCMTRSVCLFLPAVSVLDYLYVHYMQRCDAVVLNCRLRHVHS